MAEGGRRRNLLLPDVERWPADKPVIELRNVSKAFGDRQVLKDLSLTVETGKTTVIVGESGSGKSVLLRLMNGLTLPDSGQVFLFGKDLQQIGERERMALRKRCTMVFQSYALIDSMTVAENIAFPLAENTRLKPAEIDKLVDELLGMLELKKAKNDLPASLSGGMKKRVGLARAVVSNPEVVLFDEPTTGLDPVMIEFVDQLIQKTQKLYEITSVIISHDMASNRRLADTVAMLHDGRIVLQGDFDTVQRSELPEVRAFMANVVTDRRVESSAAAGAVAADAPARPRAIIEVRGVHKSFGANQVLRGVDLDVPEKQITVVIGGSGSGKSVLIKHMIGLLKPDQGTVKVLGVDLGAADGDALEKVRSRIGMLFQGAALFDSMTLRENIAFPLVERRSGGISRREVRPKVEEIARRLKVHELLDRFPAAVSNGERKRAALARALITEPDIMIYDEPTTGQDPVMMRRVDDMIVEAAAEFEITSIVISHDMLSTFRIADQIAMVYKGELAIVGSPDELRASSDPRVREFIFAGSGESVAAASGAAAPEAEA